MSLTRTAIGYRIRERRKTLGLTQADLANKLGISASYLNLMEANKRAVPSAQLRKLAVALDVPVDALEGTVERRLLDDINEMMTDTVIGTTALEPDFAGELVGRFPNWARAILSLYRRYGEAADTVSALADRLNRDPKLSDAIHQMLTHITAIRSSSEILADTDSLTTAQRSRFQNIVTSESARLTDAAQTLIEFIGRENPNVRPASAAVEVDDFIIERNGYFPELEAAAQTFRADLLKIHRNIDSALLNLIEIRSGITVTTADSLHNLSGSQRQRCVFDKHAKRLTFHRNATENTRRFQLAALAAELQLSDTISAAVKHPRLVSTTAKQRAFRYLCAVVAGATLFPYESVLEDAEHERYDLELLAQRYNASFEQICHRLTTLREPGREGIPFAFIRTDPSGFIAKRLPIPGLAFPRYGNACPLWALYAAFQTPGRIVRQLTEFGDAKRFLFVARTVAPPAQRYHGPSFMNAVMLACDEIYAGRTVYADGLTESKDATTTRVGPSCRLCTRTECNYRQEAALISST